MAKHRYLYVTDIHARVRAPIGRKDPNFLDTVMKKLWAIATWGMNNGVEAILCGGDITHIPVPGHRVLSAFADLIQSTDIPWITTLGQHDVFDYDVTHPDSLAAHLLATAMPKRFTILPNGWSGESAWLDGDVKIAGLPVRTTGHRDLPEAMQRWEGKADIVIAHVMVTPTATNFNHIMAKDVPITTPFLLTGDYHQGVYLYNETTGHILANPGALTRLRRADGDMNRKPAFACIDYDPHGDKAIAFYNPPFEEDVWTEEVLDNTGLNADAISTVVATLSTLASEDFTMHNIEEIVTEAGRRTGASEEVMAYAVNKLRSVMIDREEGTTE